MISASTIRRSRFVAVALIAFGGYSVALGLFMMLWPGTFFDTLGAFGPRNDHYIFDTASFELPLGLLLLAALRWQTWRWSASGGRPFAHESPKAKKGNSYGMPTCGKRR